MGLTQEQQKVGYPAGTSDFETRDIGLKLKVYKSGVEYMSIKDSIKSDTNRTVTFCAHEIREIV